MTEKTDEVIEKYTQYLEEILQAKHERTLTNRDVQTALTDVIKSRKVAVGGMIASGKSTLIGNLSRYLEGYNSIEEFRADDKVFEQMLRWVYEGEPIELQLQTYFIDKHYQAGRENDNRDLQEALNTLKNYLKDSDVAESLRNSLARTNYTLTDRDIIEHWLFAQVNLAGKDNRTLMFYNNLYHSFMSYHELPEVYYYLDIEWETFESRVKARGRDSEIDSWDENVDYFKQLLDMYKLKFEAQCKLYDIECVKIDANDKTPQEIFAFVIKDMYSRGLLTDEPHIRAYGEVFGAEQLDDIIANFTGELDNEE